MSTFWDRPLFHRDLQNDTIDLPMFSLHACVTTSVSIRSNFKPDLFFFCAHRTLLSCLSQWFTILSQQFNYICVLNNRSKKPPCRQIKSAFDINQFQDFVGVTVVRYVCQIQRRKPNNIPLLYVVF